MTPQQERKCEACERGEKTVTPPHSSIVGSSLVHYPSGNVCMKFVPQYQYDVMKKRRAMKEVPRG